MGSAESVIDLGQSDWVFANKHAELFMAELIAEFAQAKLALVHTFPVIHCIE
jgi:hypothetical protein